MKKAAPVPFPPPASERELIARALAESANAHARAAEALTRAASALMGGCNVTLPPAAQALPLTLSPAPLRSGPTVQPMNTRTVAEAINEFLIVKARARVSDRYLRQLRVALANFAKGRTNTLLQDVTAAEVEKWIFGCKGRDGEPFKPKTMHGYLGDVQTMFHWSKKRGYVFECVADSIELPRADSKTEAPGIHTPAEASAVLEHLRAANRDVLRMVAIRYFAGLRSEEAHRLREEDLKLDQGLIEVPAVKAKTKARRLIQIQPNLAAWLKLGGTLRAMSHAFVRRQVRGSGVTWKHNVTRHSFVSYHYALFGDAKKTAREAGHTEEQLFSHYRALATEAEGKEFFSIFPE